MAKTAVLGNLDFIFTSAGFIIDVAEGELTPRALAWKERFDADRFRALYQLGFSEKEDWFSPAMQFLFRVSDMFMQNLTSLPELEMVRENAMVRPDADTVEALLRILPFAVGAEHVKAAWIESVFGQLNQIFKQELSRYNGTVAMYFTEKSQNLRVPGRIFFHLAENKGDISPFAFLATYASLQKNGTVKHLPLKFALTEYEADQKKLLELISCLGRVSQSSELISGFMQSGELFSPLRLTAEEAYIFLTEIPLYKEAGILCRVPNWWRRRGSSIGISASIGDKKPALLGFESIVSIVPRFMFGSEEVSRAEVLDILSQTEGLTLLRGKWVEVDHKRLRELLEAFDQLEDGSMTLAEALRGGSSNLPIDADSIRVTNGEWLRGFLNNLMHPAELAPACVPESFRAVLRPYQKTGYSWLAYMDSLGLGACLADDMGLGKTVQALCYLENLRNKAGGHALLIVPASLIGNWQREIERFAPEMSYFILHGKTAAAMEAECKHDEFLTITTYAMAMRLTALQEIRWSAVLLDEAQAIKNPGARQTKSIKLLRSRMRIIMTGTPIENNLTNLWSLYDFLNCGLLGTQKEFSVFSKRLGDDPNGYGKLREMIAPFLLRRLKTDKSILPDLPEKTEIPSYIDLSVKQTVLYRTIVSEVEQSIVNAQGIQRKGLVLATIMKLKQLCNHPDQYLGQDVFLPEESGKFLALGELCQTIYENRERVLVFTQFREMTEPIRRFLKDIFHRDGLVLHGGTAPNKRTELVERFQGEEYVPFMVLSIKAGGVGLNLTAANHVIHFDRWWNPAVENQATDRAFRIGQEKNVIVHKLISSGTIEEKIDAMIVEKSKLVKDVIGAGQEALITELGNDELMNLLRLS